MIACLVCSGEDFYNAHGLYFCKICDTQTFDFHEVADLDLFGDGGVGEDGGGAATRVVTGAKIVNRSQASKRLTQTFIEDDTLIGETSLVTEQSDQGRPFTTFEIFQTILSAHTNQLLKLGFPKVLRERVFKIWCMYLSTIGEAFGEQKNYVLNMACVRERDASRLTQSNPNFISKRKREETEVKHTPLTRATEETSGSSMAANKLNMNTILCIHYLAIQLTDPLYTLTDIIRWIKDGTLPYFNADSVLPADMKLLYKDHHIFSHLVLPSHSKLRTQTANLARYLDFTDEDFPPVNVELLCIRYIAALDLPGEMVSLTLNLIRCKRPYLRFTPHSCDQRKVGVPQYEAVALSYIIIALRHLFGFHHRLHHHLSAYATAVQSQLADTQYKPFCVEKWMQSMLSAVRANELPRNNLDTQRLAVLRSTLTHYSSIAPPSSRFSMAGVNALVINKEEVRKQLGSCLDQLSLHIRDYKQQKQRSTTHTEAVTINVESNSELDSSEWGEPEITSTQQQQQPSSPTPTASEDFSTHKLGYVLNHKRFCKEQRLLKHYKWDTVRVHVQQCVGDESVAAQVTSSLMSGGNYQRLSKDQLNKTPSLLALFQICAEYGCFSTKELHDVYTVIEESYICLQNHLPVNNLSLQFLYFPRP